MIQLITRKWWVLGFRGALGVLFCLTDVLWSSLPLDIMVILFGVYGLLDGVFMFSGALTYHLIYRECHLGSCCG